MHVIHPSRYDRPHTDRLKQHKRWPYVVLLLIVGVGTANYLRPLPKATISFRAPALLAPVSPAIAWPSTGQAALGAANYGVLATYGAQTPIATASIAKVITALCVLQKLPLSGDQNGPTFTVGPNDITIYNTYLSQDASLIPVAPGEQLTERQALEALMLPSANNIADSLVGWVFKSQDAYAAYASQFVQQHGLLQTHIGIDASGFDPSTTSTAGNLVQIGLLALQNPVLMSIAGQTLVDLPVVGTVYNYNTVLGQNGITGLKTGNSSADPGAFLFTANTWVGDRSLQTVGAILGQSSLNQALSQASLLAGTVGAGFVSNPIIAQHTTVATLHTAWHSTAGITTARPVALLHWQGTPLTQRHTIKSIAGQRGTVGALEVTAGENGADTPLVVARAAPSPSFWWRLSRH